MEQERTISVPQAGKWLGVGRNAAYEAARRGEIPTIKIGRLLRVPSWRWSGSWTWQEEWIANRLPQEAV
jgi:excisionase family DNA binding protein